MLTVTLVVLLVLLALSVPVAAALVVLGLTLDQVFAAFPLYRAMGEVLWSGGQDFILIAIPFFILLGEILVRAGVAENTYQTLDNWLSRLPGGLIHANIGTAAMFSATSGSSVATAATVGTVALPQARKLGYDERLFAGSIAAGGTLGIMIPPSINLIIYGFLTETSIPRLFAAGLVPGVLLAVLFMVSVVAIALISPKLAGPPARAVDWATRWRTMVHLLPVLLLFVVIIGSIYAGIATPTEAAALGVIAALGLAAFNRRLTLGMLRAAVEGTVRTTAMIMLIILAANFLNFVLASVGLADELTTFLSTLGLSGLGTLLVVVLVYLVLGFFVETLSLMVITIPIVAPIVFNLGYDPVWFGVLLILLIEMALITPPIGLNLYVVQGVRGGGSLNDVMVGAIPFVLIMLAMAALLIALPDLALWLPELLH
jgi:tripartite ATP-independent transporter DctM subunit